MVISKVFFRYHHSPWPPCPHCKSKLLYKISIDYLKLGTMEESHIYVNLFLWRIPRIYICYGPDRGAIWYKYKNTEQIYFRFLLNTRIPCIHLLKMLAIFGKMYRNVQCNTATKNWKICKKILGCAKFDWTFQWSSFVRHVTEKDWPIFHFIHSCD